MLYNNQLAKRLLQHCWISLFLFGCSDENPQYNNSIYLNCNKLSLQSTNLEEICAILSVLAERDQKIRFNFIKSKRCMIREIDKENTYILKNILNKTDFKKIKNHCQQCYKNAWLLVQHSNDVGFQKFVIQKMEKSTPEYAYLYDRICVNNNEKQRYGTQFDYDDKNNTIILKPLDALKNLNKRRKKCGLESIEEYIKKSKILYENLMKDRDID